MGGPSPSRATTPTPSASHHTLSWAWGSLWLVAFIRCAPRRATWLLTPPGSMPMTPGYASYVGTSPRHLVTPS